MESMMSYEYDRSRTHRRPTSEGSDTMARVRAYLRSRPTESWLFFAAGIAAGAILG